MFGIISAIISGISMTLQGVFNTRLEEKVGTWETNAFVQGSAFIITIIIAFFVGKGNYKELLTSNKLYLTGGLLGVIITFTVMGGIKNLGATYAISIILVAQLLSAAIIDAFGLFNTKKLPFGFNEIAGVIIMIVGIIIFKWRR
ncbi:DMT family transporter [Clostridium fallax]|uniref:Transporter family-2 protein n=1 Tax=Clostridium fallax TaxID=1533 RepID=A0A1M4WZV5_9CLOT|nr:DMT family transporter [Clostridium fallax]SHE86796.1 transporter family-2 protein [Clostridium fallax]SQB22569.1 membrane protein [Clostridium fallax]